MPPKLIESMIIAAVNTRSQTGKNGWKKDQYRREKVYEGALILMTIKNVTSDCMSFLEE